MFPFSSGEMISLVETLDCEKTAKGCDRDTNIGERKTARDVYYPPSNIPQIITAVGSPAVEKFPAGLWQRHSDKMFKTLASPLARQDKLETRASNQLFLSWNYALIYLKCLAF